MKSIDKSDFVEILLVEDREEDGELALMGLETLANNIKWVRDGLEALGFLPKLSGLGYYGKLGKIYLQKIFSLPL